MTGHDWFALVTSSAVAIVLAAVLTGVFQRKLERLRGKLTEDAAARTEGLKSALARDLTEKTERLKHGLADELAKRTRRADYVRGQIDHLYGPLAFFAESSAHHLDTNQAVLNAYNEYFAGWGARSADMAADVAKMDEVLKTANRYLAFVVENNKETIKVLRAGWGWLDADDVADAGVYLTDVGRYIVEVEEKNKLPPPFYFEGAGAMKSSLGPPSYVRQELIDRVRRKLREKQRELAGLTGAEPAAPAAEAAAKPAPPTAAAPPAPTAS